MQPSHHSPEELTPRQALRDATPPCPPPVPKSVQEAPEAEKPLDNPGPVRPGLAQHQCRGSHLTPATSSAKAVAPRETKNAPGLAALRARLGDSPESQWKHVLDLKPHPHGAPLHACRVLRGYVAAWPRDLFPGQAGRNLLRSGVDLAWQACCVTQYLPGCSALLAFSGRPLGAWGPLETSVRPRVPKGWTRTLGQPVSNERLYSRPCWSLGCRKF